MENIGAIILAGGKGKRMNMLDANKVTLALVDKPMIRHIVDFMHGLMIDTIVVVVGFAKESVIEVLKDYKIIYAEQIEPLGTGHAVACALEKLPEHIENVLVVYGDDAVLYAENHIPIIKQLFDKQDETHAVMTFLTIEQDQPFGLGRIVRDEQGKVHAIVEEKDATEEEKQIKEINPGCFVFSVPFLKTYLPKIEKSPATGEYYLTSLIDLAFKHGEPVETVQGRKMAWRGVNTPEELQKAVELYKEVRKF